MHPIDACMSVDWIPVSGAVIILHYPPMNQSLPILIRHVDASCSFRAILVLKGVLR